MFICCIDKSMSLHFNVYIIEAKLDYANCNKSHLIDFLCGVNGRAVELLLDLQLLFSFL